MSVWRSIPVVVALVAVAATAGQARDLEQPASFTPEGGSALARVGVATRAERLGDVELYSIALYASLAATDRTRLRSVDQAKVLRIVVGYEEDVRDRLPIDWRAELVPRLEAGAAAHIRGSFAPLRRGDVVLIEYVPGEGTTVRVNRAVAVAGAGHKLMLSFLDHWIGQRPLSEDLKRALLGVS